VLNRDAEGVVRGQAFGSALYREGARGRSESGDVGLGQAVE